MKEGCVVYSFPGHLLAVVSELFPPSFIEMQSNTTRILYSDKIHSHVIQFQQKKRDNTRRYVVTSPENKCQHANLECTHR